MKSTEDTTVVKENLSMVLKRSDVSVQVVVSQDGSPVGYYITAGSVADITAFQAMNLDLPPQSTLYADSAYTDYELEGISIELSANSSIAYGFLCHNLK